MHGEEYKKTLCRSEYTLEIEKGTSNGVQVLAHLIEDLRVCLRDSAATAVVHVIFV